MIARKQLNYLAVPLMLLMAAAVLDATVSRLFTSDSRISAQPGTGVYVSGTLEAPVLGGQTSSGPAAEQGYDPNMILGVRGDGDGLSIRFEELTGTIWRAYIQVDKFAEPGQRIFYVHDKLVDPGPEAEATVLTVYPDLASYRASFHSLFLRYLGIKAWWVAAALLPVSVGLLVLSFMLSSREEEKLRSRGIGSIYKLAQRGKEWELVFGLGLNQGIAKGDVLDVLDENMNIVCEITALEVAAEHSAALVEGASPVRPGHRIARRTDREQDCRP
ncbi:MAG: hypothetical protein V3573_02540 [Desulfovibrionaceae bacterium]